MPMRWKYIAPKMNKKFNLQMRQILPSIKHAIKHRKSISPNIKYFSTGFDIDGINEYIDCIAPVKFVLKQKIYYQIHLMVQYILYIHLYHLYQTQLKNI